MLGGAGPQVLDQTSHQGRRWPMCPGAWCEMTGVMRMAGVKEAQGMGLICCWARTFP